MKINLRVLVVLLSLVLCGCSMMGHGETAGEVLPQEDSEISSEPVEETVRKDPAGDTVAEGVYDISSWLQCGDMSIVGISLFSETRMALALLDEEQETLFQVYDLEQGALLDEKRENGRYMNLQGFAGNDGFGAVDEQMSTAVSYKDGQWQTVALPEATEQMRFYGDGQIVSVQGNTIYRGQETVELTAAYEGYTLEYAASDGTLLLSTYEANVDHYIYFLVDPDGQVSQKNMGDAWTSVYHDWYVMGYEKQVMLYNAYNTRSAVQFTLDTADETIQDIAGHTLMTVSLDNKVRLYDVEEGSLLAFYECPANVYYAVLSPDGGTAVLQLEGTDFYRIDAAAPEKAAMGWPGWIGNGESAEACAKGLEQRYPVSIYIGEDAVYPFQDFAVLPLTENDTILEALQQVERVLEAFPEGFLEELLTGEMKQMHIYITGQIIGDTARGSTSNPIAFAYPDYFSETQYIVLDGRSPELIITNMSHELMHAIDTYITDHINDDFSGFIDWEEYQPADFWYNYSYQDEQGMDYSDTMYTFYDENHETYFIDSYSKTFDIEDRARIFENLFTAGTEGRTLDEYAGTPLMRKAEYLSEVIREAFTSVKDETVWESALVD